MQSATQRVPIPVATITASAENLPNEGAARLNDGLSSTKWFASATTGWVVYQLSSAKVVTRYTLTSANDFPNRDPKSWQFQGSTDGVSWTTIDTRTGQEFAARFMARTYVVSNSTAYSYYRLNITANNGNTSGTQLAEWNLYDEEAYFAVDQAAAEAIESAERRVVADIKIDWNDNGGYNHPLSDVGPFADDIVVDRVLSGSAPPELMLIEGSAAAELSFTLGGDIPVDAYGLTSTGQPMSWVSVLTAYNGNSPLYSTARVGVGITYRIGVETAAYGTVWYPQFIGNIRLITPDRASNSVKITALDRSELMRTPVNLPIWAISSWHAIRGYSEAQLMSSHWVIDQCLRAADISPSPFRPISEREGKQILQSGEKWGLQLYISGNSAHTPSVGLINSAIIQGFPWSEGTGADMFMQSGRAHPLVEDEVLSSGKFPQALNGTKGDSSGAVPRLISQAPGIADIDGNRSYMLYYQCARLEDLHTDSGGTHWLGFTLQTEDPYWTTTDTYPMEVFIGYGRTIRIHLLNGSVRSELWQWTTDGSGVFLFGGEWKAIPTGLKTVQIDCQVGGTFASNLRLGTMVNGSATSWNVVGNATVTNPPDSDIRFGLVKIRHRVGMSDIYWANQFVGIGSIDLATFEQWRRPAKYAAVLDEGLNKLTFTPTRSYEDGWSLATAVASAEMGAVFWDENGIFRFWNRNTMLSKQETPVRTLTLDDIGNLSMTESSDSVRTVVEVETTETVSRDGVALDLSDPERFYLAPGVAQETQVVLGSTDTQVIYVGKVGRYATTPDANVPLKWDDSALHGYVVEFNTSGNVWEERNDFVSGVDLQAYCDSQGNITLRFFNGYNVPARISKLHLRGTTVFRGDATKTRFEDSAAIDKYHERNWLLSGEWVQPQPSSIKRLGEYMLDRSKSPIPATDNIPIAGDPRLQLGDTIRVVDPDGFGEEMLLQVLGIRRTLSKTAGLEDDLTVEMIRPAGVGIFGSSQYGRLGQTFTFSS